MRGSILHVAAVAISCIWGWKCVETPNPLADTGKAEYDSMVRQHRHISKAAWDTAARRLGYLVRRHRYISKAAWVLSKAA